MNETYLSLLQKNILKELARKANEHAPLNEITITEDNVMENLIYIWDEIREKQYGQETGRVLKFMPKRYKEMVMRLIYPTASFTYSMEKVDTMVICKALLYLDRLDNKPVSIGQASVNLNDFADGADNLDTSVIQQAEALAKGLAESKALQKMGIGIWFSYDLEEENSEALINEAQNRDSLNPTFITPEPTPEPEKAPNEETPAPEKTSEDRTLVPVLETESTDKKASETTDKDVSDDTVAGTATIPPEAESSEVSAEKKAKGTQRKQEKETPSTSITLEEALALPADCGKAKGKGWTLGETAEKAPANLFWMYNQEACSNKEAILVIARANETVGSIFKEYNIEI